MEYAAHVAILICVYGIAATSLNLIAGYAGIMSVCHAAFCGIGAYVAAIMSTRAHLPFVIVVPTAAAVAAGMGLLVGLLSSRLRNEQFLIATLAFQGATFAALNNWVAVTGGPMGIPDIPEPVLFGWHLSSHGTFLLLAALCCGGTLLLCRRIASAPLGRLLKAIREDDVAAQALGKDVTRLRVEVFGVGAAIAAVAGALYAYYVSFVDPTGFTIMDSIFLLSAVIVGGAGGLWGAMVGTVILVALPEALRFIGLPNAVAANVRQLLHGALLWAFMVWRPQGLLGDYPTQGRGGNA